MNTESNTNQNQGHEANTVLAASGPTYESIRAAAYIHVADNYDNEMLDEDKKLLRTLFIAGAEWAIKRAACASGAGEKAVCGDCGEQLTLVRPGKHQCDNEKCPSNNRAELL